MTENYPEHFPGAAVYSTSLISLSFLIGCLRDNRFEGGPIESLTL